MKATGIENSIAQRFWAGCQNGIGAMDMLRLQPDIVGLAQPGKLAGRHVVF
ncbi:MAG: hypothetical protein ACM3MD_10010 [Betaproteobacteria bacterium]